MLGVLDKHSILDLLAATPPLIEGLIDPDIQVQPNGVDLTLQSIATFLGPGAADFSNRNRVTAQTEPFPFDDDAGLHLTPGAYLVSFNEVVHLPLQLSALGRTRSSLLRSGAALHTAVWDAGYSGRSQSLMTVYNPSGFRIYRNARVMQLVFLPLALPAAEGYSGIYLNENLSDNS